MGRVRLIKMIWLWKSGSSGNGRDRPHGTIAYNNTLDSWVTGGAFHGDALKWMHPEVMQVARP